MPEKIKQLEFLGYRKDNSDVISKSIPTEMCGFWAVYQLVEKELVEDEAQR